MRWPGWGTKLGRGCAVQLHDAHELLVGLSSCRMRLGGAGCEVTINHPTINHPTINHPTINHPIRAGE